MTLAKAFFESVKARSASMKAYAEGAIEQLTDDELDWMPNAESNSISVQIRHLHGNMVSRWTDPLTTDGEKPSRDRDSEFEDEVLSRRELMERWEEGWAAFFGSLESFSEDDLLKQIHIRGNLLSLLDGIHRQFFHSAYHVGQIVGLAKQIKGSDWKTLSIPRGQSKTWTQPPK